jgi:CRISPR-associated protein Cmr3
MSYKYLVTLKPVGEFFFGGEQNFSMNDLRNRVSFFAKSFMFMQQNSILGMLRREILRKKGFLKIHINGEWPDLPKRKNVDSKEWIEIKKLVGYEPFCFEKEIETGIIEEISETFLKEKYRVFYPMPFDEKLNPQKEDIEVSFNGRKRKFINFGINPKRPRWLSAPLRHGRPLGGCGNHKRKGPFRFCGRHQACFGQETAFFFVCE